MTEAKSVTLEHFALFREYRNTDREEVSTLARDARELYQELKLLHGFPLPIESLRVAVNDEFDSWEKEIRDGDKVAFIAPVAGG